MSEAARTAIREFSRLSLSLIPQRAESADVIRELVAAGRARSSEAYANVLQNLEEPPIVQNDKPGPPQRWEDRVTISLSQAAYELIKDRAAHEELSMSMAIRNIIRWWILQPQGSQSEEQQEKENVSDKEIYKNAYTAPK